MKARGQLGAATRYGNVEAVVNARRSLAAAKLEDYVSQVVAEAPPLTEAQANRIASMLRPYGGDAV